MGVLGMLSSGNLQCFPHTELLKYEICLNLTAVSMQFSLPSASFPNLQPSCLGVLQP